MRSRYASVSRLADRSPSRSCSAWREAGMNAGSLYMPTTVPAGRDAVHEANALRQEPVLGGEQGGGGARGDPELAVRRLHLVADGLGRAAEPLGDLPVREAAGDQAQHLRLPLGEPGR